MIGMNEIKKAGIAKYNIGTHAFANARLGSIKAIEAINIFFRIFTKFISKNNPNRNPKLLWPQGHYLFLESKQLIY